MLRQGRILHSSFIVRRNSLQNHPKISLLSDIKKAYLLSWFRNCLGILRILCEFLREFFVNSLEIFCEFFENSLRILCEFFGNSTRTLLEFFGNSLEILWGFFCDSFWDYFCINFGDSYGGYFRDSYQDSLGGPFRDFSEILSKFFLKSLRKIVKNDIKLSTILYIIWHYSKCSFFFSSLCQASIS